MHITVTQIDANTLQITEVSNPSVGVTSTNQYTIDADVYASNVARDKNIALTNLNKHQVIYDSYIEIEKQLTNIKQG